MATIKKFEELEIWQLARQQAREIHCLLQNGSFSTDYGLKQQISRSSGSVMDNIAEGFERFTAKDFMRFLFIAKGSNGEVRSQLYRAFDKNHISDQQLKERLEKSEQIGKKLSGFIKYLQISIYQSKPQPPTSNLQLPT